MRNRFSRSVKSLAGQFVWSHWHCLSIRNLCQTREAVTGQIENDTWTNTLKKLSHRCMSSFHFDVSKHFDKDNYVRSRFFFAYPSLHWWYVTHGFVTYKMTECVSHCERNRDYIVCQKIWFWLPQNTPWCKVILMYQRRKCVSHRQQEKTRICRCQRM